MNKNTDFLDLLQQFIDKSSSEYERIQQELRDNDELVRQSMAEVERLAQRNSQLRSRIAAMENQLESHSRADIRSLYQAASDAQLRLFMMRSRMEQLQGRQQVMERHAQSLQSFMALVQFLPSKEELLLDGETEAEAEPPVGGPPMMRIIEAQEAERLMLARQMHDGPAQSLTNLILQAEICEKLFDRNPDIARQELGDLKGHANKTFQKVRDFIFELRPMMLDDLGLAPTLKRYLAAFEEQHGVSMRSQFTGVEQRIAPELEITLFRAIQELLNNSLRHAHATQLQVTLDLQGTHARVVVEDDGGGFNVSEAMSDRKQRTVGLTALRERVEMFGGEINFESAVGHGTRVTIRIPLREATQPRLLGGNGAQNAERRMNDITQRRKDAETQRVKPYP